MFTKAGQLRDEASVFDFIGPYSADDLRQMGSLERVVKTLQDAQIALGVAEDRITKVNSEMNEMVKSMAAVSEKPASKKKTLN